MLVDRIIENIEWPGRQVRSTSDRAGSDAAEGTSEEEEVSPSEAQTGTGIPPLIDPKNGPAVRESLDQARKSLDELQAEADRMLDETVDIGTDNLPGIKQAAQMVNGTHPIYGDDVPAIDPEDQTGDGSGRINGETFRTAHEILEKPDQNVLKMDVQEAVFDDAEGNKIEPYGPVKTPRQAAGRDPVGRLEPVTMPEAFAETEKAKKLSIWKRAFYPIISLGVRFIGDMVYKVGDKIKNMFSIKIPRPINKGYSLSRPIAAGFYMIADVLYDAADYLMDKALGLDPTRRAPNRRRPPDGEYEDRSDADDNILRQPRDAEGDEYERPVLTKDEIGEAMSQPAAYDGVPERMGDRLTEASYQVVQATVNHANDRMDEELALALQTYNDAKQTRLSLNDMEQMARAFGVPSSDETPEDAPEEDPTRTTAPETVPVAEEKTSFEKC